jgi:predicted lipoprotein with Yx(FWY)xxD motif
MFRPSLIRLSYVAVALGAALALAACGGKNNSSGSNSGSGTNGGGAATVSTKSGPLGTYLVDGSGRSLYLFAADTGTVSTCVGTCKQFWPPLTTTGSPKAGNGVQSGMLTTSTRPDGGTQVDYNGHPLYYYASDTSAGQTSGQGLNLNGGLWWLVSPAGTAIQGAASS